MCKKKLSQNEAFFALWTVGTLGRAMLKVMDGQWMLTLQNELQQKKCTNTTLFIETITYLQALNTYTNQHTIP